MQQVGKTQLKALDYEMIEVGEEFGPAEIVVDEHRVRSFVYAVDDFNPWYLEDSPFGGPIAPPSMMASHDLWWQKYDPNTDRGIAATFELRFTGPVKVGQTVIAKARHAGKYIKRDKPYVFREAEVLGENGKLLLATRSEEMPHMKPGLRLGGETAAPPSSERITPRVSALPVVARARADVPVESPLPTITKRVTLKQMVVFSAREGWWWENMHTSNEFATSIGLEQPIAAGLMSTAYLCELCLRFFGESWFKGGWIRTVFVKPVYAEDTLQVKGIVSGQAEEAEGARLKLDMWCENQHGAMVTAGRASAPVG
jgi:acyl dehydratase